MRLKLIKEFGIGKEARAQRKEFLSKNGGYKGLRKTLVKEGTTGLNKKVSAFKNRPGQNNDKNDHLLPDKTKPKDNPKTKDPTKPDVDKEWDKKSDEKLDSIKSNPKHFKKFEADNKKDAIAEVNDARTNKDIAKLRGIVDKALDGQKFSSQEKLAAFGLGKKDDLILSGNANEKGEFGLYKAMDTKKPFAKISIGDKGEFKYEPISEKKEAQPKAQKQVEVKPESQENKSPNETNSQ